jgi:hypothetical protein
MLISGPRSSALGSEQGTTACMLLVGQGGDHLTSSLVYHSTLCTNFYSSSLFVSSSGYVGVGTNDPNASLHINGTPGQNNPSLRLTDSAASGNGGNVYISADKTGVGYNNLTTIAFSHTFKGGGSATNYLTIDSNGISCFACQVCAPGGAFTISTTNGGFNVKGVAATPPNLAYLANNYFPKFYTRPDANYGITIFDQSEAVAIQAANLVSGTCVRSILLNPYGGNVGIGNCSPLSKLHIGDALANSSDAPNAFTIKQTSTNETTGIYLERSGERKGYYIYVGGSVDSLNFQRNNAGTKSDTLTLTRDGNVGVGLTNPVEGLDVQMALRIRCNTPGFTNACNSLVIDYVNTCIFGSNPATRYYSIGCTGVSAAHHFLVGAPSSPFTAFCVGGDGRTYAQCGLIQNFGSGGGRVTTYFAAKYIPENTTQAFFRITTSGASATHVHLMGTNSGVGWYSGQIYHAANTSYWGGWIGSGTQVSRVAGEAGYISGVFSDGSGGQNYCVTVANNGTSTSSLIFAYITTVTYGGYTTTFTQL